MTLHGFISADMVDRASSTPPSLGSVSGTVVEVSSSLSSLCSATGIGFFFTDRHVKDGPACLSFNYELINIALLVLTSTSQIYSYSYDSDTQNYTPNSWANYDPYIILY